MTGKTDTNSQVGQTLMQIQQSACAAKLPCRFSTSANLISMFSSQHVCNI